MKYLSARFGELEIPDSDILHFPVGILGFEGEKKFALLPFDPNIECPLQWLHSLQAPELAFVVTDPYTYMPDYQLTLSEEEKKQIDLAPDDPFQALVIVKIPQEYTQMTANYVAPLVINPDKRLCRQFVLATMKYDTQHYLLQRATN